MGILECMHIYLGELITGFPSENEAPESKVVLQVWCFHVEHQDADNSATSICNSSPFVSAL